MRKSRGPPATDALGASDARIAAILEAALDAIIVMDHTGRVQVLSGALGDEELVRHIISNLLSNAVKYSPEGSPVDFSARREGRDAVFQVADRGLGIPAEGMPQLFSAFYRGSNVSGRPGTGLGLSIVKKCVDLHGGEIALESTEGVGTTVRVRLPLFPSTPTPTLTLTPTPSPKSGSGSGSGSKSESGET